MQIYIENVSLNFKIILKNVTFLSKCLPIYKNKLNE